MNLIQDSNSDTSGPFPSAPPTSNPSHPYSSSSSSPSPSLLSSSSSPPRIQPWVTLTFAQSLDGYLATRQKTPLMLSSPPSLIMTHTLRSVHQGILIGSGTLESDNPKLTSRHTIFPSSSSSSLSLSDSFLKTPPQLSSPRPILLDSRLSHILPSHDLITQRLDSKTGKMSPENGLWIFTSKETEFLDKRKVLESLGVSIFPVNWDSTSLSCSKKILSWPEILTKLYSLGLKSLMVEGGVQVLQGILCNYPETIQLMIVTLCPVFLGRGLHLWDASHLKKLEEPELKVGINGTQGVSLTSVRYQNFGSDMVLFGSVSQLA